MVSRTQLSSWAGLCLHTAPEPAASLDSQGEGLIGSELLAGDHCSTERGLAAQPATGRSTGRGLENSEESPPRAAQVRPACAMSTAVSCQEPSFVGGQRYDCPYSVPTSAESVDVSKETLVSFWAAGPLDNTVCLHEPSQQETVYNLGYETEPTWTDHLSPQLQRNKQLQDTLLQREEELARLQEENNKLKEFLNSSIVKCLEDKTKKLLSAQRGTGTRNRKRMLLEDGKFSRLNASHLLLGTHGKRTCRNLSLDFCSAEELAATPPMDSWILQTLGLKDEDTIDPSADYSTIIASSANYSSSINPSAIYTSSTDSSSNYSSDIVSPPNYSSSIDSSSIYSSNINSIDNYSSSISSTANYSSNINSSSNSSSNINCSANSSSNINSTANYSPSINSSANSSSNISSSTNYSCNTSSSSPAPLPLFPYATGTGQHHTPTPHCLESSSTQQTLGGSTVHYPTPGTPRVRTEVAFSMSLEPWSSVRTHSFPQGQAFVCRDTCGGWNFTWVPKDTA
ncbi:geminin coiled-coil domain-containing protein 1 [Megalops cyprinoides]|uniref:geminin coiled-coil domain-containing protein 1 n=1 Tax=Megalops cyprinoides TaxID=118141 RepID=UPI001864A245|nr:geminin coiled-coil domain-containing protein 1 [Megalops cyprinoides]